MQHSVNINTFRISAKRIFLTYCNNPPLRVILEALQIKLQKTHNIQEYLLTQEESVNSRHHAHVYLQLEKRLDTRNPNYLDIESAGVRIHPNIQKVYTEKYGDVENEYGVDKVLEYMLKDICNTEAATSNLERCIVSAGLKIRLGKYGNVLTQEAVAITLAEQGRVDEALKRLKERSPLERIINYKDYKENFEKMALDLDGKGSYFTQAIQAAKSGQLEQAIKILQEKEPEAYLKNSREYKKTLFDIAWEQKDSSYDVEVLDELKEVFEP